MGEFHVILGISQPKSCKSDLKIFLLFAVIDLEVDFYGKGHGSGQICENFQILSTSSAYLIKQKI